MSTAARTDIDWSNLGFGYVKTNYRYVSRFKNGQWDEGGIETDSMITLSECACVFQYSQSVFEGLKAYRTEDGKIVCFRPDLNAARMAMSAARLEMPPFPEDRFIEAVKAVVKANEEFVPPYGSGATLYLRPFMIGTNPVIGVKPAEEFEFRIFVTPVGPYFKGGAKPIVVKISDFDRAAPHGTGNIKAGLNYAMSLHPIVTAHAEGFAENMYLDPQTRTKVEETGGANIIFITKDGKLVTPAACAAPLLSSLPWAASTTTAVRSTSPPAWRRWVPGPRSSTIPSPVSRWAASRPPKAGSWRSTADPLPLILQNQPFTRLMYQH